MVDKYQAGITAEYLQKLVLEDNWRALLITLVLENKLDPWNVDIKQLSHHFANLIYMYHEKGFYIPSNILLALVIILKLKALSIKIKELNSNENNETYEELEVIDDKNVDITIREPKRKKPKLPLSINEIIKYVEKYTEKISKEETKKHEKREFTEEWNMEKIYEEDIRKKIDEFYNMMLEKKKATLFSIASFNNEKILEYLIYTLFLASEDKIDFYQHRPFEDVEIFVKSC